jgi:hypothetical protein
MFPKVCNSNLDFFIEFILDIMVLIWEFILFSFFSWRVFIRWKLIFHDGSWSCFLMVSHQGKSTYLLKSKTFLMKDGKQKNGEDFLTQPIHVLEHLMPLNPKLSILFKTNWWWLSTIPWHDHYCKFTWKF